MIDLNMLFYVFSILLVISRSTVVIAWHPIFSLLSLVASFVFSVFLLFLLKCELLGLLFIVVYVGAIATLFSIMLESKLILLCQKTFSLFGSSYNLNYFHISFSHI